MYVRKPEAKCRLKHTAKVRVSAHTLHTEFDRYTAVADPENPSRGTQ